jgi:hypothetical protein
MGLGTAIVAMMQGRDGFEWQLLYTGYFLESLDL